MLIDQRQLAVYREIWSRALLANQAAGADLYFADLQRVGPGQ